MRIGFASDHAGFVLKERLRAVLSAVEETEDTLHGVKPQVAAEPEAA